MGPLPIIVGAGILALFAAAASKSKASPASSSTTSKPGSSSPAAGTTAAQTGSSPLSVAPAYLSSVPYVIAMRVIALSDPSLQQAQGIWLADNGYRKTGNAVFEYSRGNITAAELQQIAQAEFAEVAANPQTAKPKQGTTELDRYGSYLLENGDADTLYSYALASTSIPLVQQAAARFAAAGDTRAFLLTQHLADLTL